MHYEHLTNPNRNSKKHHAIVWWCDSWVFLHHLQLLLKWSMSLQGGPLVVISYKLGYNSTYSKGEKTPIIHFPNKTIYKEPITPRGPVSCGNPASARQKYGQVIWIRRSCPIPATILSMSFPWKCPISVRQQLSYICWGLLAWTSDVVGEEDCHGHSAVTAYGGRSSWIPHALHEAPLTGSQ